MSRREVHLTHDHVKAAVEMVTGAFVTARSGTPDEAWAWREDVPRCGTVYMVKGPLVDGERAIETRAHDTPERAIADLAGRLAPAPKPAHLCPTCVREWRGCQCSKPDDQMPIKSLSKDADELTVDDVLAFVERFIGDDEVMFSGGWTVGGPNVDAEAALYDGDGDIVLAGTLREVLTEAKRRGLLG